MDDANPALLRMGMLGFMLFIVSFFNSCSELQYYMGKKETTARVSKIYEKTGRHGRHLGWSIGYKFRNEDTDEMQKGYVLVSNEDVDYFSVGQEMLIEYRGSSQLESRMVGDNNKTWVYIFLGSMVFTVGTVAFLSWQSMQEEKKKSSPKMNS